MEQLTAERKRLLPIFKDMRNDLNIEYSEENFDIKKQLLQFYLEIIGLLKNNEKK